MTKNSIMADHPHRLLRPADVDDARALRALAATIRWRSRVQHPQVFSDDAARLLAAAADDQATRIEQRAGI